MKVLKSYIAAGRLAEMATNVDEAWVYRAGHTGLRCIHAPALVDLSLPTGKALKPIDPSLRKPGRRCEGLFEAVAMALVQDCVDIVARLGYACPGAILRQPTRSAEMRCLARKSSAAGIAEHRARSAAHRTGSTVQRSVA